MIKSDKLFIWGLTKQTMHLDSEIWEYKSSKYHVFCSGFVQYLKGTNNGQTSECNTMFVPEQNTWY